MKTLKKYLKKRKTNIQSLVVTPSFKYTPDIFHELRVEIKKLRSLLSLLKFSSKNFKEKKMKRPFDKIFKLAGKIRESHIEEEMLKSYFSADFLFEYRQKLKERKTKYLGYYNELVYKEKVVIKKSFSKIKPWISKVNKEKIVQYLDKKNRKIQELLDLQNIHPSQIHLLRKRLKQYNYSIKYLNKTISVEKDLENLADLTGKWHDGQVLLNHLDKHLHNPGIHFDMKEQVEKIRNEQIIINNLAFNQIKYAIQKDKTGIHSAKS